MIQDLGSRMKGYEAVVRQVLEPHTYTILRVDGRAFHTYLKNAEKPYDFGFIDSMKRVAVRLCKEVSGTVMAYGQSDEISLLVSDIESQSQPWFGGVVQKMASVSSSIATALLMTHRGTEGFPHFDSRVFTIPREEIGNYFVWRQRDAMRNSVAMLAQYKFSHKQLHGVNSGQMKQMLLDQYGIDWDHVPTEARQGWIVKKSVREAPVEYVDKRTQDLLSTTAVRTFWEAEAAPYFSAETFAGVSTEAVL